MKRLIEVDLPIKRISAYAQKEKNLRSGHPWHLHIWWARRPWGACRAVALASLLPAPTDSECPDKFIKDAVAILREVGFAPAENTREKVQDALLNFVAEFSRWEAGAEPPLREAARKLVTAASPEHKPVVFDSFSGYGAIPGEAARLGCESIALDLNPVAILCLRTLLDATQRHGSKFIESFREGTEFVKREAEQRLGPFYSQRDGRPPIAYLWARTVTCEAPNCGATIPLISQTSLAKGTHKAWVEVTSDTKTKKILIHIKSGKEIPDNLTKTAGGGHAVCPVCGVTTNKSRVKVQGKEGRMGHRLFGVALAIGSRQGKEYADANDADLIAVAKAEKEWNKLVASGAAKELDEPFHLTYGLHVPPHYGIRTWGNLFSPRQKLALHTIGTIIREYGDKLKTDGRKDISPAVVTALSLVASNTSTYLSNLSYWGQDHMNYCYMGMGFAMRWDWAEAHPLVPEYAGGFDYCASQAIEALSAAINVANPTTVLPSNATQLPMPDDSADMYFSDPPYYDVVPYADLSDLCYVWLKRFVGDLHPDIFSGNLTPKAEQIVVNPYTVADGRGEQSSKYYQERMTKAFDEARRVLKPEGIGAIVFAHKGTEAWETLLASILNAGFKITASWPIDTERAARQRANDSAALGSSVHLVVRPRENPDGSLDNSTVGDWREVLAELPLRMHEWMARLREENVVGADAIFSCLGPAFEIYSRYARVERSNGEKVGLSEYLEQVWSAIAREALNSIFTGADASGFEEDARLTVMWLWTLRVDIETVESSVSDADVAAKPKGFALEFDAANMLSKGLGVNLDGMKNLVEVKGDTARLLPATERAQHLFGKEAETAARGRARKKSAQLEFDFVKELDRIDAESGISSDRFKGQAGATALDRVHQAMLLFSAGRGEALKRFLVEDGIGRDARFWRLAQALSALYPSSFEEKRWVDGVLARKKGLGL